MIKGKIQTRLIFLFVIQVVVILLVSGYYLHWKVKRILEEELSRKLEAVAKTVAVQLEGELIAGLSPGDENSRTYRNLQKRLQTIREAVGVRRIYLFTPDHRSLVDTERAISIGWEYVRLKFDQSELEKVFAGQSASSVLFRGEDGRLYKSGYAPIYLSNRALAAVGVDGSAVTLESVEVIRKNFLTLGMFGLLGAVILAVLFSKRITGSLMRLQASAQKIGSGNYAEPIEISDRDEIGFLGRTLEEMRRNIVRRDVQQKAMLAGVAHEIRNPLGGIELFAGLLAEESENSKEYALKILKEVRNLKEIVNNFLDYARPNEPQKQPCSLREVLVEVRSLLSGELGKGKITMEIIEKKEGLKVFADPGHLKQIFLNLAKNSVQAMPRGGLIKVEAIPSDDAVEIFFIDNGSGVPPEARSRIFEPFFTTQTDGMGLGLAIVKSLTEENGGTIELISAAKGTSFKLTLPKG